MRFSSLRQFNDRIAATTGVYEREAIIREALDQCEDEEETTIAAQLLLGKLTTPNQELTFGIKETFLAKDLGLEGRHSLEDIAVTAKIRAETGEANPDIAAVYLTLWDYLSNPDRSNAAKSAIINKLLFNFVKSKDDIPFLLQILCEKVNNGIDAKSVLYAATGAKTLEYREQISRAFAFNPNIVDWLHNLPEPGTVIAARPIPGVPMEPQLCARVTSIEQVLKEHEGISIVQPKLDGQRVHIHLWRSSPVPGSTFLHARIFSRTLKNITEDYPEIVRACVKLPFESSIILDGELVALGANGEIAPFKVLQKRLGRKTDKEAISVGVVFYDILNLDSRSILNMPYDERLSILDEIVPGSNSNLRVIPSTIVSDSAILRDMLLAGYEEGEEGLVCKSTDGIMTPGGRTKDWVKLKVGYMEGNFGDTMDLIVIGYNKGRGKRHGKIGALWLGIWDSSIKRIRPICKVGTGFSDEELDWWTENLEPTYLFQDAIECGEVLPAIDFWVEPTHIVEIRAAEVTEIDHWSGYSLRFPRYIKRRNDKGILQSTSLSEFLQVA